MGPPISILVPYVGNPIYEVTFTVASLGEIEGGSRPKGIRHVKISKGIQAGKGPGPGEENASVGWSAGSRSWDRNKTDKQPKALLLELRR